MKPIRSALFLASLAMLMGAATLSSLDKAALSAKIKAAYDGFASPSAQSTGCDAAFLQLVEVAETAAPESGFPAAVGAKISEARRLFETTSIMNPDGVALLRTAYIEVNEGRPYEIPEGLADRDSIMARFRTMTDTARRSMEAGQTGAALKSVLEILILTVTPVEAH